MNSNMKVTNKIQRTDTSYETTLNSVIMVSLLITLLIPAFIGIYHADEFYIMHIITAIPIIVVLLLYKSDKLNILQTPIDYMLLGLTFLFLVSIVWAVWPHAAIEEGLKYINYFLIFWFIAKIVTRKQVSTFITMLFYLGTVMSLFGIIDYLQLTDLNVAVRSGRITGTLLYTNAFAAYIASSLIFGFCLFTVEQKHKWAYSVGSYFMLIAFIGTLSRAMWLFFWPFLILYLIGFKGNKRDNFLNALLIIFTGLSASIIVLGNGQIGIKLLVLVSGALICSLPQRILDKIKNIKLELSSLVIIISTFTVFATYFLFRYIFSSKVLERIMQVSLQENSVVARVTFYKDAWNIIMEKPLFGHGGGAWESLFELYRSYLYNTPHIHSHILEIGVATGLLGMLLFAGAIIYILVTMFKAKESVAWALGCSLLAISAHSMVDQNLAIGFLALVVWALMGAFTNSVGGPGLKSINIRRMFVIIFIAVYLTVSTVLLVAANYSKLGENENYVSAYNKLKISLTLDPFHAKNHATLANLDYLAYQNLKEEKYLVKAIEGIDKAIAVDRFNYNWCIYKTQYLVELGKYDDALLLLKEQRDYLAKFDHEAFQNTAKIITDIAKKYDGQGNFDKARNVMTEVVQLWDNAQRQMEQVTSRQLQLWIMSEKLTEYDPFLLEVIKAYSYIGEKDKAKELVSHLSSKTIKENQWLNNI